MDNTVLNRILNISSDENIQFNALCKVLYKFGGVCNSTQETYITEHKTYGYYNGIEEKNACDELPDLAMPLSIKQQYIDEFIWDNSSIETKLYEAIQLPKPRPRGKYKGKGDGKRKGDSHGGKKGQRSGKNNKNKPIGNVNGKRNGTNSVKTPVVNNKIVDNDVLAMFGDGWKDGTKPDNKAGNVEEVLGDIVGKEPPKKRVETPKGAKKDLLFDLFGDSTDTMDMNKSKNGGEPNEKQKQKMRIQAGREIKKLINSLPDLSFLKS
eukprot:879448_1